MDNGQFPQSQVLVETSSGMANASPQGKRHLLDLAYLGLETNLDNFGKFDTELGVTSFATMTTSVEK